MGNAQQIMEAVDRLIDAHVSRHEVQEHEGSPGPNRETAGNEVANARRDLTRLLSEPAK